MIACGKDVERKFSRWVMERRGLIFDFKQAAPYPKGNVNLRNIRKFIQNE